MNKENSKTSIEKHIEISNLMTHLEQINKQIQLKNYAIEDLRKEKNILGKSEYSSNDLFYTYEEKIKELKKEENLLNALKSIKIELENDIDKYVEYIATGI